MEQETNGADDAATKAELLPSLTEQDSNLIDIINSMEADRKKFLAHVRSKISTKETAFEVSGLSNYGMKSLL